MVTRTVGGAVAVVALIVAGTLAATGVLSGGRSAQAAHPGPPASPVAAPTAIGPTGSPSTSSVRSSVASRRPSTAVSSAGGAAATVITTVRPVTSAGVPATGYAVTPRSDVAVCNLTRPTASPVAVDDGILECFPSALYLVACWSTDGGADVLCLRDVRQHELVRLRTQNGTGPVSTPARRIPLQVRLSNGAWCSLRAGGTGDLLVGHHDWTETYFCDGSTALWSSASAGWDATFSTTGPEWTAQYAPIDGTTPATTVRVTAAYFVGTAAG